ncbi:hypothetical protein AF72_11385 [Xylella taiwanensis]|uniref:Uncharacterized protein n=1 Tax=Xylella taiwanensis TaxID=1444770 RepID=Z9JH68_9GAMM|nr:hypothetical protein AB672_00605 [Xylella taiwanensis]EWS77363.1 hypothetical protein AF72_11385 [Xylella taiwanensis]
MAQHQDEKTAHHANGNVLHRTQTQCDITWILALLMKAPGQPMRFIRMRSAALPPPQVGISDRNDKGKYRSKPHRITHCNALALTLCITAINQHELAMFAELIRYSDTSQKYLLAALNRTKHAPHHQQINCNAIHTGNGEY